MYRTLLTLVVLALAAGLVTAGLVVPTAASGTEDRSDGLVLEPSDESNGEYAELDHGELVLDLEGLNDDAVTTADDVFTITGNRGVEGTTTVWIEHDVDGLAFYADDDRSAEITQPNPLRLSRGETASVGVSVDTRVAASGTETFTVNARWRAEDDDPPELSVPGLTVTSAELDRTEVEPGEPFEVTATVENQGTLPVEDAVDLEIGGTVVGSETVALEPGAGTTVTFTHRLEEPGTYPVSVSGVEAGSVTVTGTGDVRSVVTRQMSSPLAFAVVPPAGLALLFVISGVNARRRS